VDAAAVARDVDSVCICLSKGLSAPIGSVLAGSAAFIDRARKVRKSLGGALRQGGIVAAPGLVALRTGVARLAEDHGHARRLAGSIAQVPGLHIDLATVQTNIVNLDVSGLGTDAATFASHLMARGVRGLPGMGTVVRFVTYRGITRSDIEQAIAAVQAVVADRPWKS
jgi:threonine aldolase